MNKKDPKHTQGSYENTLQNNEKKKKSFWSFGRIDF